jgi:hypothetical protein
VERGAETLKRELGREDKKERSGEWVDDNG